MIHLTLPTGHQIFIKDCAKKSNIELNCDFLGKLILDTYKYLKKALQKIDEIISLVKKTGFAPERLFSDIRE